MKTIYIDNVMKLSTLITSHDIDALPTCGANQNFQERIFEFLHARLKFETTSILETNEHNESGFLDKELIFKFHG